MRADEITDLWTKYASNPVLSESGYSLQFGQLAPKPGGGWYFFGARVPSGPGDIYRWESTDLITWTGAAEVLSSGGVGAWDEYLQVACVFQKPDESWVMFYRGYDGANYRVGKATSADGTTWTRKNNGGVNDGLFTGFGDNYDVTAVILVDTTYYIYVNGDPTHGHTNLYTTTDLDTCVADENNPIFKNGFCSYVFVNPVDSKYYMLIPRDLDQSGEELYAHGIALYRCATPVFTVAAREYLGYAIINNKSYDSRYLDMPTFPFTDIDRMTYGTEFDTTLYMLYSANLNGITQCLASSTFAAIAALDAITETATELP